MSRLETIARAQRLRYEADLVSLRSRMAGESDAGLRAQLWLREDSNWPHARCAWVFRNAERTDATLKALAHAAGRIENDARIARDAQRGWACLRRGLERRAARKLRT